MFSVHRLPSGYYHIRGVGLCNWTQPSQWPCEAGEIEACAFPEASPRFLAEVEKESNRLMALAQKARELEEAALAAGYEVAK